MTVARPWAEARAAARKATRWIRADRQRRCVRMGGDVRLRLQRPRRRESVLGRGSAGEREGERARAREGEQGRLWQVEEEEGCDEEGERKVAGTG